MSAGEGQIGDSGRGRGRKAGEGLDECMLTCNKTYLSFFEMFSSLLLTPCRV